LEYKSGTRDKQTDTVIVRLCTPTGAAKYQTGCQDVAGKADKINTNCCENSQFQYVPE